MIYQYKNFNMTLFVKLSITAILYILICLPLSNIAAQEKTVDHLTKDNLKVQLLEDSTFLSRLSEKIIPQINDNYIRQIITDYLLNNPEILIQMQFSLQEKFNERKKQEIQTLKSWEKEIFQSSDDAILGNPNGKVTLVEFFDYNCKYCKTSYPHIMHLIKEHPNLQVIIKDLPILGPDSVEAHLVAYAFRKQFPQKYSQFYKMLLTSSGRANESKAIKIATSLGADETTLRKTIKDPNIMKKFQKNVQIASELNINGTPSFIIDDKIFVGAVGEDILKREIENAQ
ncbi:DsbA family protein [Bartonella sp. F02]|uniref:DsbA family protein n=1 Tax=Bartonella sp. F02 TaxID=2967262 RepID=UPI0022A9B67B|nr:DsbA family protein [Bartonella sp. F02]MCZ2328301.1 DsbA family protein [Bartonella sp. F02]